MSQQANKGRWFQIGVVGVGAALWLLAGGKVFLQHDARACLLFALWTVIICAVGMFPQTIHLPTGLNLSHERITFTLTDALVLLVAYQYGVEVAVFIQGIEAFSSSRRIQRQRRANKDIRDLYSAAMMTLAMVAAGATLTWFARHTLFSSVFAQTQFGTLIKDALALTTASLVLHVVNMLFVSGVLAIRHGRNFLRTFGEHSFSTLPLFLPTGTIATLMFWSLGRGMYVVLVICVPLALALALSHRYFRKSVQQQAAMLEKAHRETIEALAVTINAKDEVTHEHVLRVQIYAAGVAKILGCTPEEVEALRAGALLHDIGKIAVPDYILNKPGKLTAAEFDKMKIHTIAGAQILSRVDFPYPVVPVVRSHHERWDGKGYPDGLQKEDIPLTARILSVVDCFDALREDRQYRKGLTREAAIEYLQENCEAMYDPKVVDTFIEHLPEFEREIKGKESEAMPDFGIVAMEKLSEAALQVAPAAGLAKDDSQKAATATPFAAEEISALYELSLGISASGSYAEMMEIFGARIGGVVPFETLALTLPRTQDAANVMAIVIGKNAERLRGHVVGTGGGVTGWAIANRQAFFNTDPILDLPATGEAFKFDYRTLGALPLITANGMVGAVTFYTATPESYTENHQRLMREAVKSLAIAVERIANENPLLTSEELSAMSFLPENKSRYVANTSSELAN